MFVPIAASHSFPTSEFTIVATSRNGYKLSEKRYRVWIIKNGMNNEWSVKVLWFVYLTSDLNLPPTFSC